MAVVLVLVGFTCAAALLAVTVLCERLVADPTPVQAVVADAAAEALTG